MQLKVAETATASSYGGLPSVGNTSGTSAEVKTEDAELDTEEFKAAKLSVEELKKE